MLSRAKNTTRPPRPSSQGAPPGSSGQKKEIEKAPSVAGGAQKIPVRIIQRTRNLFGSPAQGGLKNERGAHHSGRAIETAHDDIPKDDTPKTPDAFAMPATIETTDRAPRPRADHPLNITRLNGCCLCAISQLESYASRGDLAQQWLHF
jgi:hypothetical protein